MNGLQRADERGGNPPSVATDGVRSRYQNAVYEPQAVLRVECRSDSDSQRMTGQDDLNVGGTTGTVYRYSSRTDNVSVRAFLLFRSLYRGKEDTVYSAMAVRRRTL